MTTKSALLKKEFVLAAVPITYIFISFTLMTFIPGYPIEMGAFFVCMGIFQTFRFYNEANDIFYSVMLPVSKKDIVKSKYKFTVIVELISFLLITLFAIIRMMLLKDVTVYTENPLMNANAAFLGWTLIVFAMFNIFFVGGFFKTGYKYGIPFFVFSVMAFIVVAIGEAISYFPGLEFLGQTGFDLRQLYVLGIGSIIYILGTSVSLCISVKRFEKIDL